MLKIIRENNNLQRSIILSLIFHIILFYVFMPHSSSKYSKVLEKNNIKPIINTVTIDLNAIKKKRNPPIHQEQKQTSVTEHDKYQSIKQIKEHPGKQAFSQKNYKYPKKEQFSVLEITNDKEKQINKIGIDSIEVKEKIKKIKDPARIGDTKTDISDFFSNLNSDKNASSPIISNKRKDNFFSVKNSNINPSVTNTTTNDISSYAEQIRIAIEKFFYDASSYTGKICRLRISLSPDGVLLGVKSEHGDPVLCTMALAAARQAKIPHPPSKEVYEIFKNVPLDFKP